MEFRTKVLRFKQREMADALGCKRSTYGRYEGKTDPIPFAWSLMPKLQSLGWKPKESSARVEEQKANYGDVLDRPKIPVGYPPLKMRFAGNVPTSEDWGDPLASEEFVDVEAEYEHPKRFMAQVVGNSCYPALQQGDQTIWHHDLAPPYGQIVLAQRKGDHGCTVKKLVWDDNDKRARLEPVNPEYDGPADGEGWGVIARLVAVIRTKDGPKKSWYWAPGLRPEDLV